MYKFEDWISKKLCVENRDAIIVFEDNLLARGTANQAIIRDEPNAFGLPTKRIQSLTHDSYFSDREDEIKAVVKALNKLRQLNKTGKTIIMPVDMTGSVLSKLNVKSPKICKIIDDFYKETKKGK